MGILGFSSSFIGFGLGWSPFGFENSTKTDSKTSLDLIRSVRAHCSNSIRFGLHSKSTRVQVITSGQNSVWVAIGGMSFFFLIRFRVFFFFKWNSIGFDVQFSLNLNRI